MNIYQDLLLDDVDTLQQRGHVYREKYHIILHPEILVMNYIGSGKIFGVGLQVTIYHPLTSDSQIS